ncbi:Sperm-associated antigen 16 protein, partial [Quaeritorhiza haematococci]
VPAIAEGYSSYSSYSSDEEDDLLYEEVPLEDFENSDTDEEDPDEDLDRAVRHMNERSLLGGDTGSGIAGDTTCGPAASLNRRPEVIDDYIRNYLTSKGLVRSLEAFQNEWYEFQQKGKLSPEDVMVVPDVYHSNQELAESLQRLRADVEHYKEIASKARATYDKLRKERDFHRMHHKRVVQEKNRLVSDVKRLRKHYEGYEPALKGLQHRYEVAMKEKMLTKLERDRLGVKASNLEITVQQLEKSLKDMSTGPRKSVTTTRPSKSSSPTTCPARASPSKKHTKSSTAPAGAASGNANGDTSQSQLPTEDRPNPYA